MNSTLTKEMMLSLARSRIYSYLAACFRYPDEKSWAEITSGEEPNLLAVACTHLAGEKEYRPLRKHRGGFSLKKCESLEKLQERYQEVFGHTVSRLHQAMVVSLCRSSAPRFWR